MIPRVQKPCVSCLHEKTFGAIDLAICRALYRDPQNMSMKCGAIYGIIVMEVPYGTDCITGENGV